LDFCRNWKLLELYASSHRFCTTKYRESKDRKVVGELGQWDAMADRVAE